MTALFRYPRVKHVRKFNPTTYKNYRSYKPVLQEEFNCICVYCRQVATGTPNLNFGIDHYRPKKRFPELECVYTNLYYCCSACNTRKKDYWPADISRGPYVVNPCEYEMGGHLRFNARTGMVESQSKFGRFTEGLLQLNDELRVSFRRTSLAMIQRIEKASFELQSLQTDIQNALREGHLTQKEYDEQESELQNQLNELRDQRILIEGAPA